MPLKIEILSIMIGYDATWNITNFAFSPYVDYPQNSPYRYLLYCNSLAPSHYLNLHHHPEIHCLLPIVLSLGEVVQKTYSKISFHL